MVRNGSLPYTVPWPAVYTAWAPRSRQGSQAAVKLQGGAPWSTHLRQLRAAPWARAATDLDNRRVKAGGINNSTAPSANHLANPKSASPPDPPTHQPTNAGSGHRVPRPERPAATREAGCAIGLLATASAPPQGTCCAEQQALCGAWQKWPGSLFRPQQPHNGPPADGWADGRQGRRSPARGGACSSGSVGGRWARSPPLIACRRVVAPLPCHGGRLGGTAVTGRTGRRRAPW